MTPPHPFRPAVLAALLSAAAACARRPATPAALLEAFDAAVDAGDAEAAWRLLAPEVRDRTDRAAFERRFADLAPTLRKARLGLAGARAADRIALVEVTTEHPDGRLLDWVTTRGATYLVAGLPAIPRTDTPAAAVRGFVAALRAGVSPRLGAVATPELVGRLERDWEARAARIEAALADPSNLTLSADGRRAILRYGDDGAIRLVRTPAGWRVDAFE